ncbi:MAG: hypothetical protein FJY85_06275, partial [Deltaproteobacteria bacterium]|nr:hypothetical protein [Deltaproteobacteria bacterium]
MAILTTCPSCFNGIWFERVMDIPNGNFIKIDANERNLPIYRVIPVWRFAEMLVTQKLVLTRPDLWDDPFENILLKTQLELSDSTLIGLDGVMGALYGQCWSLHEETDAMWRIYVSVRRTPFLSRGSSASFLLATGGRWRAERGRAMG